MRSLTLPMEKEARATLHAGECVLLSGTVFTARDCAHKRIFELLDADMPLPFALKDTFLYYAGPCPAPAGRASGSCGPTTSSRMEPFAPRLLRCGLGGMIGKGELGPATLEALRETGGVYFAAIGGAGALYGNAIKKSELVAFPELLSEAVFRLTIEDFPVIVAVDPLGNSIFGWE